MKCSKCSVHTANITRHATVIDKGKALFPMSKQANSPSHIASHSIVVWERDLPEGFVEKIDRKLDFTDSDIFEYILFMFSRLEI